jgi:hypothetical protein
MGKKRMILTVVILCACALAGCKTTRAAAETEYSSRWEKTRQGMSVEEFREVWPQTKWVGKTPDGKVIYVSLSPVVNSSLLGSSLGFDYFLFENDQFVRSGLFLYTTGFFRKKQDYGLQLFMRDAAKQAETSEPGKEAGKEKGK